MLVVPSEETITSAIPAAPISLRAKPKRSDLVKGTSFKPLAALFALDALLTRLIPFPAGSTNCVTTSAPPPTIPTGSNPA